MYVAKTKALISFAVAAELICVFVFAYALSWFSHDAAHTFSKRWPLSNLNRTKNNLYIDILFFKCHVGKNEGIQYSIPAVRSF